MKINKLAIPLMLNSVASTIINLCDQAMVGRTHLEGFASVGIIGSNIYSLTGVLGMLAVGFNILGSKAKGANDEEDLNDQFVLNLILNVALGVIFFVFCYISGKGILEHQFHITGDSLIEAANYLYIFSLSLGINLILFTFSSYFKIQNQTKFILYGNLISCVGNVILDYVLIFGKFGFPKLGIVGNAIGSVTSLCLCLLFYLWVIRNEKLIQRKTFKGIQQAIPLIKVSLPMMGQEFVESSIVVFMMNYILSQIGLLEVSIYNLLFSIIHVALMPMYAYSQAALTMISEDIGAYHHSNVTKTTQTCMKRALLFYLLISITSLLVRNQLPKLITNDEVLIFNAANYLFLVVVAHFMNIPACLLKASLQALGKEKMVFVLTAVISFMTTLLIYTLVCLLKFELRSIYIGLMIGYILTSLVLAKVFYQDREYLRLMEGDA